MCTWKVVGMLFLAAALTGEPALAQLPGLNKITGKSKDEKIPKDRDKQVEKSAKQARTYDKLKEFSLDLYEKDPDFREDVERNYDEVQRQHSEDAFERNVEPPARPTVVNDGDRLRLQTGLYDNKIVQDYVNRVGQQLVPEDSDRLFAFRLVAHPIPFAETLSTGTIYISTGLISLLDNEAQLAYVLAHEMAHVYKDHWKLKSILAVGEEEYNKKQERKRQLFALGAAAAGAALGGAIGRSGQDAGLGALAGGAGGYIAAHIFIRGIKLDWDKVQEDEADKIAFKAVLNRNYDVQEIPNLYLALQEETKRDQRVGIGFMGSRKRVQERIENVKDLLAGAYKAEVEQKLKEGKLVGSGPDFAMVMSELKRDNGILAFYHDMFQLAKSNLEYAVSIRSNDPAAHYYYGKVLKLVGRTSEDSRKANQEFTKAASLDTRNRYYGAHFYRALALMSLKDPAQNPEIVKSLQEYLNAYLGYSSEEAALANYLPANLDDMYDYLAQAGEVKWTPKLPEGARFRTEAAGRGDSAVGAGAVPASLATPFGKPATGESASPQGPSKAGRAVQGAAIGAVAGHAVGGAAGTVGGAAIGAKLGASSVRKNQGTPKKDVR